MVNQNLSANTVVRKITFSSDAELHQAIDQNLTSGSLIYKLDAVVSIDPVSAYIVLTPDVDKVTVNVVDIRDEEEAFPDAPNGDTVIMSIDELRFLKEHGSINIVGEDYTIDNITISYSSQGERTAEMFIRKA